LQEDGEAAGHGPTVVASCSGVGMMSKTCTIGFSEGYYFKDSSYNPANALSNAQQQISLED